jgi:acetyltransferase-like isoleucine patch superfamily enzyme
MKMPLTAKLLHVVCRIWLRSAHLGRDSFIAPPFRISNPDALSIGTDTRIGQYAFLVLCPRHNQHVYQPRLSIGNHVRIGNDLFVGCQKQIAIGNHVLISSRVFIADTMHQYEDVNVPVINQDLSEGRPVIVDDHAFIGVNACILPGVHIGKHGVVAAGAVVTRDVPPFTVVAGNPAVPLKRYSPAKDRWERVV